MRMISREAITAGLKISLLAVLASAVLSPIPAMAVSCPIVDYGDDYAHYRDDQFIFRGKFANGSNVLQTVANQDIDSDGDTNDSISYVEFQLNEPLPVKRGTDVGFWNWDRDGNNALFYPSRVGYLKGNPNGNVICEGGGPNQNHSAGADDINMMGWAPNSALLPIQQWGLWLWKKENFINGGATGVVSFSTNSYFALHCPRYWMDTNNVFGRFVARDGDQFYISQFTFAGGYQTNYHQLNPTQSLWAPYNPQAPYNIIFDTNTAFAAHTFTNVTAVGYYIAKDPLNIAEIGVKLGAFEVGADVARATPAWALEMVAIPGGNVVLPGNVTNTVPSFLMSAREISYKEYYEVYRAAIPNMYCRNPGYYFDEFEPDMGSMKYSNLTHGAFEPATDVSWLDAVAWCNALSEREGRTPVYYADTNLTTVFRMVLDRWNTTNSYTPKVYVNWAADGFRLPTAAEWKLAWTAGAQEMTTNDAWIATNSAATTHPTGGRNANSLALYDMAGNVWEWCWDAGSEYDPTAPGFSGKHMVLGGDFHYPLAPTNAAQSASPYGDRPYDGNYNIGLRVVCRTTGLANPPVITPGTVGVDMAGGWLGVPVWTFATNTLTGGVVPGIETNVLEMVSIPGGTYNWPYTQFDKIPLTISNLYVGKYEVSYEKWLKVYHWALANGYSFSADGDMGSMIVNIGQVTHSQQEPVTRITISDAMVWCNALSEIEGRTPCYYANSNWTSILRTATKFRKPMGRYTEVGTTFYWRSRDITSFAKWDTDGYRLPSEAEANYYYGGAENSSYYWGSTFNDTHVWYDGNAGGTTHPVGLKSSNPYGLYDLCGNVGEFLWDPPGLDDPYDRINPVGLGTGIDSQNSRATVFGSFWHPAASYNFRRYSAARVADVDPSPDLGFRVVRCNAGTHPANGDQRGAVDLMPNITSGQEAEPLQGLTYHANTQRTGVYTTPGLPVTSNATPVLRWRFLAGEPIRCAPVVASNTVYVGSLNHMFYAVDARSGTQKWSYVAEGKIYGSPSVYNGKVYFGALKGDLYALDAATGSQVWKVNGVDSGDTWTEQTYLGGQPEMTGAPAISYGLVFAALNGKMRGYDLQTGELKWTDLLSGKPVARGTLALHSGKAFWGHSNTTRTGTDMKTGVRTSYSTIGNDTQVTTPMLVSNQLYYVGGKMGVLYCRNLSGASLWSVPLGSSKGRSMPDANTTYTEWTSREADPAIGFGWAIAPTESNHVCGINLNTKQEAWIFDTGDTVRSGPSIDQNGRAYFGCNDGYVYCLNITNGQLIWKYNVGSPVVSSIYLGANTIYFGADDGYLYALIANGNQPPLITAASVSPTTPTTTNNLSVGVSDYDDPNADPVSFTYQWQESLNGTIFSDLAGQTASNLSATVTVAGNYYRTVITPRDPATNGAPFTTASVWVSTDANGNQINDDWEVQYFGHIGIATGADPDGDGFSNEQEYLAGTNPTNSASALRLIAIQPMGTNYQLQFTTQTGKLYTVEYADVLPSPSWSILASNIVGASGTNTINDPGAANKSMRFYRIRLQP